MDQQTPRGDGPPASARALGKSILELLGARAELVAVELKLEARQRKRLFALAFVAAIFLIAAMLLFAVLVVVWFWDTHRLAALATLTAAYFVIGAVVLLRLRFVLRDSPPPFSATLDEFRKDLDLIRGRDE